MALFCLLRSSGSASVGSSSAGAESIEWCESIILSRIAHALLTRFKQKVA